MQCRRRGDPLEFPFFMEGMVKNVVFSNHWSQKAWFWLFSVASTGGLGGINNKWSLSMHINLKIEFLNSFYYAIIHSIEYENTFIIFYSTYREI